MGALDNGRETEELADAPREQRRWFGGSSRDLFSTETAPQVSERAQHMKDARKAVEDAYSEHKLVDSTSDHFPVSNEDITERTTANRINLADNVPLVQRVPERGGYLDVVMHGDSAGTQANIDGVPRDFTLDETVSMIRDCPAWEQRPIRLMSCSTGKSDFAQELADSLGVPVYAPTDLLEVRDDGTLFVHDGGSWKRFEPML